MTAKPSRGFASRPGDAEQWVRSAEQPAPSPPPPNPHTARLTIDITPELRRRLKLVAVQQGLTVADMLRALLDREYPRGGTPV